jgi:hypothetical protein
MEHLIASASSLGNKTFSRRGRIFHIWSFPT